MIPVSLFRQNGAGLEPLPAALFRQDARGQAKRSAADAPASDEGVDFIAISQISSFWNFAKTSVGEVAPALREPIGSARE